MENLELKEIIRFYEQYIKKLDGYLEVIKAKIGERSFDELQYMYRLGIREGYSSMLEEIKDMIGSEEHE